MREVKRTTETPAVQGGTALARAVTLHLDGKGREALKELDRAVESGDPPREVYAAKGHIQFELEMYEDGVKSYESLLGLDPNSTSAYFNLAVCQEKLGRWSEAAANFQRALASDEGRLDARLGLGVCLLHMKQAEKAMESFDAVLEEDAGRGNTAVRQGGGARADGASGRGAGDLPQHPGVKSER